MQRLYNKSGSPNSYDDEDVPEDNDDEGSDPEIQVQVNQIEENGQRLEEEPLVNKDGEDANNGGGVEKVGNMTRWRTEAGTIDTASNFRSTARPNDLTTADMTLIHQGAAGHGYHQFHPLSQPSASSFQTAAATRQHYRNNQ